MSPSTVQSSTGPCDCIENQKKGVTICKKCRSFSVYNWSWDNTLVLPATVDIQNERRDVILSPGFSVGTVAVRGDKSLQKGFHHYWEIQMSAEVYGTDVMLGVGTDTVDLNRYANRFVSFIGLDQNGWGLSYTGQIHHNGKSEKYCEPFGLHAIIGIHLDMWAGTLEFFLNRKPLGVAFRGLQDKILFPIISSTSARSGMNLIYSRSFPTTLQIQALLSIGKNIFLQQNEPLFKCLDLHLPPGLLVFLKNNYWWITTKKADMVQEPVNVAQVPKARAKPKAKPKNVAPKRARKRPEKRETTTDETSSTSTNVTEDKYEAPMTRSRQKTNVTQEASSTNTNAGHLKRKRPETADITNKHTSKNVTEEEKHEAPMPRSKKKVKLTQERNTSESLELRPRRGRSSASSTTSSAATSLQAESTSSHQSTSTPLNLSKELLKSVVSSVYNRKIGSTKKNNISLTKKK